MKRLLQNKMFTIITSVVLGITMVLGGAAGAAFFFEQQQGATVRVMGAGIALFLDPECTIPMAETDILDFGTIRESSPSSVAPVFYAKNTAPDSLDVSLMEAGLPVFLEISHNATGAIIGVDPGVLLVDSLSGSPLDLAGLTMYEIEASFTEIWVGNSVSGLGWQRDEICIALGYDLAEPDENIEGYYMVNDELIRFTGLQFDAGSIGLLACERGFGLTTAATHPVDSPSGLGRLTAPTLLEGEILTVQVDMTAGPVVEFSQKDFSIILTSTANY